MAGNQDTTTHDTGSGIHLIATGGTIDKQYDAVLGTLVSGEPVIARILTIAGLDSDELRVSNFLQKDSLDITDAERADLADFIATSPSERILVTHGTDTMNETAEFIARATAGANKTVVLTGAMLPYSVMDSDATFNVGSAYVAVQLLSPGVYIAMHGRVFHHNLYVKNKDQGRFVGR